MRCWRKFDAEVESMKTEECSFWTSDGLRLECTLFSPEQGSKKAVVHVHGYGGNYRRREYVRVLAEKVTGTGWHFFAFNNRGQDFFARIPAKSRASGEEVLKPLGGAREIFEDSPKDIQGALDFLDKKGIQEIVLEGHSYGCQKAAWYAEQKKDARVRGLVLLAPWETFGLLEKRLGKKKSEQAFQTAEGMVREGKEGERMPQGFFPYPISAGTYVSFFNPNRRLAFFEFSEGKKGLERVQKLGLPAFLAVGGKDDAIALKPEKAIAEFKSIGKEGVLLPDADHIFTGKERELGEKVAAWLSTAGL